VGRTRLPAPAPRYGDGYTATSSPTASWPNAVLTTDEARESCGKQRVKQWATITTKDGTPIYYNDWGKGAAPSLHHGCPLSSDAWEDRWSSCGRGYRCIAHGLRGHPAPTTLDRQPRWTLRERLAALSMARPKDRSTSPLHRRRRGRRAYVGRSPHEAEC